MLGHVCVSGNDAHTSIIAHTSFVFLPVSGLRPPYLPELWTWAQASWEGFYVLLLPVGGPRLWIFSGFACGIREQLDILDTSVTARPCEQSRVLWGQLCGFIWTPGRGARADSQTRGPSPSAPRCISTLCVFASWWALGTKKWSELFSLLHYVVCDGSLLPPPRPPPSISLYLTKYALSKTKSKIIFLLHVMLRMNG